MKTNSSASFKSKRFTWNTSVSEYDKKRAKLRKIFWKPTFRQFALSPFSTNKLIWSISKLFILRNFCFLPEFNLFRPAYVERYFLRFLDHISYNLPKCSIRHKESHIRIFTHFKTLMFWFDMCFAYLHQNLGGCIEIMTCPRNVVHFESWFLAVRSRNLCMYVVA